MSQPTPLSLLQRLKRPDNQQAWQRFVRLYTPLLFSWSAQLSCPADQREDLVQDAFLKLVQVLPTFEYRPGGAFRGYLYTLLRNLWWTRLRAAPPMVPLNLPDRQPALEANPQEQVEQDDYRHYLVRRALVIMESDFPERTWKACWAVVAEGRLAAQVAEELGMTPGAVHAARFRVLARLREELVGLVD